MPYFCNRCHKKHRTEQVCPAKDVDVREELITTMDWDLKDWKGSRDFRTRHEYYTEAILSKFNVTVKG